MATAPTPYVFCTYFDSNYLSRALALFASLRRHCPQFLLYALCLDEACHRALAAMALPELRLVCPEDLERAEPRLAAARAGRSPVEYYFTCTPFIARHALARLPEGAIVTYVDADIFFFADPAPLFAELGAGSVAIVEHRHPDYLRAEMEPYGRFNVGWISFRNDPSGRACLDWWGERCLEWCYDRAEPGRYADQKYLERWPELFAGVVVLQHRGANLAPWNFMNYRLSRHGGRVLVDGEPLIFYHFHGFKQKNPWLYDTHTAHYVSQPGRVMVRQIIEPYIRALRDAGQGASLSRGLRAEQRPGNRPSLRRPERLLRTIETILRRQQVIYLGGRVL